MNSNVPITTTFPQKITLALLSSGLVIISTPTGHLGLLSILWIVPLIWALNEARPTLGAWLCFLSAFVFWCFSISWTLPALIQFSGTNPAIATLLFIGLCFYLSIPYCLFGYLYTKLKLYRHSYGALLSAALFTIILIFFPTPIPGLPIHNLYKYPLLLQTLAISGLSSLIFCSMLFQLLLVQTLQNPYLKKGLLQLIIIMIAVPSYGYYHYHQYQEEKANGDTWITIGFVQPDLRRKDNTDSLVNLSESLVKQNPALDLLVWPEFPPDFSLINKRHDKERTLAFAKQFNQNLMVVSGYVYATPVGINNPHPDYYNSAQLIRNGIITEHYNKQMLVPFFEYLPGRTLMPFLNRSFPDTAHYIPGKSSLPLNFDTSVKIIPAICYEAIFPELIRKIVANGGNILINPASDTWFGKSAGSSYHLAVASFRTIENNIPWLRATNSGISVAVEASGDIIPGSETLLDTVTTASYSFFIPKHRTIYSRYGDWFTPALIIFVLINGLRYCWRKRNSDQ